MRVSRNRGERTFPEESFVRTLHSRGEPDESLRDSQITFQGDSNGLSVIDRRENSRSVDLRESPRAERTKRIDHSLLKTYQFFEKIK